MMSNIYMYDAIDVKSEKGLLDWISDTVSQKTDIPANDIFDVLWEREKIGTTAMGDGIALPLGIFESLNDIIILVIKLNNPVDYAAPDGEPVHTVVAFLSPNFEDLHHLEMLSDMALDIIKSVKTGKSDISDITKVVRKIYLAYKEKDASLEAS